MLRRSRLRHLAISASVCAVLAALTPAAQAQEVSSLPAPLPDVSVTVQPLDSAALVEQVRTDAAAFGTELPTVDTAITDQVDQAVNQFLPTPSLVDDAPAPSEAAPAPEVPAEPVTAEPVQEVVEKQKAPETPAEAAEPAKPAEPTKAAAPAPAPLPAPVEETPLTNPNPIGIEQIDEATLPVYTQQNYWWRDDIVSKVAAMKPQADYILHRVPGSWFDAPRVPETSNQAMTRGHSLYGPGTPIYVGNDSLCTLTVAGTDEAGRKIGITAGHCGEVGDPVSSADSWQVGPSGTVVHRNESLDYSVIEFGSNAEVTNTYNNVTVTELGGDTAAGQILCKTGVATNETCGMTLTTNDVAQVSQLCSMVGDSGAPVYRGGRLVGMVNGGVVPRPFNVECHTPWQGALHSPTATARIDAVLADINLVGAPGAGFRVADAS